MKRDDLPGLVRIGPRVIESDAEFAHLQEIRTSGFTPWYVGTPRAGSMTEGRPAMNAIAEAFPEFCHQARTPDNRAIGYFATVPGYWGGSPQALPDLHHFQHNLRFGRRRTLALSLAWRMAHAVPATRGVFARMAARLRAERLREANCIVLVAMTIDPQFQGLQLPMLFFDAVRRSARSLGMSHIIAPFRPSGYGQYKAVRNTTHSADLFKQYCEERNEHGLPVDPWFRAASRNGATFLRPEPRSFRIERPLAKFEQLRRDFKPQSWYNPQPDVWECGETPTWYVDRGRGTVTSVEPNLWGHLKAEG